MAKSRKSSHLSSHASASAPALVAAPPATSVAAARSPRLALLIDADNITPAAAAPLLEAAARRGTVAIRRAYGDWTTTNLTGWKDRLHVHAIQPVQQFAYSTGKNATDGALIIEAMDLLYTADLDGFVIVSSDSDFTRLATRLREAGKIVYGCGERKTNKAFVAACDEFVWIEDLRAHQPPHQSAPSPSQAMKQDTKRVRGQRLPAGPSKTPPRPPKLSGEQVKALLTRAVMAAANGTGWVSLSLLGQQLHAMQPGFEARPFKSLRELVSQAGYLRCQRVPDAPGSRHYHLEVRLVSELAPVARDVARSVRAAA
ncbi:NYN domain-containing protein [Paraburkholderia youngii]|uniref:NYN domain-containing protein n=1 Tax=Paraburkholderia youngii TaxID=2782701 RepID=UPI003D1D6B23